MDQQLIEILKAGKVAVIPTDTIYGIVGSALNQETVEKIYKLRKRNLEKPFIILISEIADLEKFGVNLSNEQKLFLEKHWPNPLSVILPVPSEKFKYLHRGTNSLAFRMPNNQELLDLLKEAGPLVAPSVNYEGEKPAETIDEAKKYFGDQVDLYIDGGVIKSNPSTLIELNKTGEVTVLRPGQYKV